MLTRKWVQEGMYGMSISGKGYAEEKCRKTPQDAQDKKKQRKEKQSTQGIYLDAFNLAALTQQHRVKIFLARLRTITSKVTLRIWVLPGLGDPSLPPKHHGEK